MQLSVRLQDGSICGAAVLVRRRHLQDSSVCVRAALVRQCLRDSYICEKGAEAMKKAVPVIVAVILIVVIGAAYVGGRLIDKYSYSKETADLDVYYGTGEGQLAIVLQDEMLAEKAETRENYVYFDTDTMSAYLNEGFYIDYNEQKLIYTTAVDNIEAGFGAREYTDRDGVHEVEYTVCYEEEGVLYVAAEYIKRFTNFSYEVFDRHLQMYTEWGEKEQAEIAKDTQVRLKGGIKSPVLRELAQGETVEILEQMETWSKVKTADSIIGYVENKRLENYGTIQEEPVADYVPEPYTGVPLDGKLSLGWHAIGGVGGNDTLAAMLAEQKGLNVIAPTWFSLTDSQGGFRSFASTTYIEEAHRAGLQVWGVWDNFNYRNETKEEVDTLQVLSVTSRRQQLAENMVKTTLELGLDGINIDYEGLSSECGRHYVQFLRELSVLCRREGLPLSIDNYVPFHFNDYYRLDVQGEIADYVIIMGYDEHWHGSGNPGSVASIDYVSNGLERTLSQVPAQKVVNALPFYTILWKTVGSTVTDEYITLNNLTDFMGRVHQTAAWDEGTCQNYAEWKSGDATYQIWLEDEQSIRVKLNVMSNKGIGGVAVWRIGYGTPEVWEMVAAYAGS